MYSAIATNLDFDLEQGQDAKQSYLLWSDNTLLVASTDVETVVSTFERELELYIAEHAKRRVFVHAGVVGWKGRAILIPGRSLSGKTTLVAELVRAGATYYSDDYAVLDARGRVHPYPRPLSLRAEPTAKPTKHPVEELGGKVGTVPLPAGLVIVSSYRPGAHWRPRRLSVGLGVLELLSNTVSAQRQPDVVLPVLQQAVSQAMILKGTRGEALIIRDKILAMI